MLSLEHVEVGQNYKEDKRDGGEEERGGQNGESARREGKGIE